MQGLREWRPLHIPVYMLASVPGRAHRAEGRDAGSVCSEVGHTAPQRPRRKLVVYAQIMQNNPQAQKKCT